MLQSSDTVERGVAFERIRNLTEQQPKALQLGLVGWLPSMLEAGRFDDVEETCRAAILGRPQDTNSVVVEQRARVLAMLRRKDFEQALPLAKGYFNVAPINRSKDALSLLTQAVKRRINNGDEGDTAPLNDSSVAEIQIDASVYDSRIEALSHSTNFDDRMASANLCLLAGRPLDALAYFESNCRSQQELSQKQLQAVAEGISRSIHARDIGTSNADALIKALRRSNIVAVKPISSPLAESLSRYEYTKTIGRHLALSSELPPPSKTPQLPIASASAASLSSPKKVSLDFASSIQTTHLPRFIMSMCQDLQGNLWIGSEAEDDFPWDRGVWRYDILTREWTQFTTKDGLGDDNGYALACDHQGRVWAGHLNHGVSVFANGHWQNYDVVGDQSGGKSLAGPLGERVSGITVCPVDGDVWIATNEGLTRYSDITNRWCYYTQNDGLPSNQINGISFDAGGNIYVGTSFDGIAMAPRSSDYQSWSVVHASRDKPLTSTGDGLPTDEINQILVSRDNTVWAATTAGLAWSNDHGLTWQYMRSQSGSGQIRTSLAGTTDENAIGDAQIPENYVTCIAEDERELIWIGTRRKGYVVFDCGNRGPIRKVNAGMAGGYITCLVEDEGTKEQFTVTYPLTHVASKP